MQEVGEQQEANVHTIDIGIGSHNHFIVAQSVNAVLNVESCLQKCKFLIFHHLFRCQPVGVQWFTTKREHGLSFHIADFGDRTTCRQTLGDEDRSFLAAVVVFRCACVVEVHTAVAQFAVMERHFLGTLTSGFRDAGNGFTLFLACQNLLQHDFGGGGIFVEIVVKFLFHEVVDKLVDCRTVFPHHTTAEFDFGLRLKHRLLHLDADGGNHTVANVAVFEVFAVKLLDGARHRLAERSLVRTTLCGVLAVDKRIKFFAHLCRVRYHDFDVFATEVHYWVKRVVGHVFLQQVAEAVA